MKKSELTTGMLVQLRNDKRYMVLLDYQFPETNKIGILLGENSCLPLDKFDEDLKYVGRKKKIQRDIVQVRKPQEMQQIRDFDLAEIIWEREENTLMQDEYIFLKMLGQAMYLYRQNSKLYMSACCPTKLSDTVWAYQSDKIELNSLWFEFINTFDSEAYCSYDLLKLKVKPNKEDYTWS